MVFCLFIHFNLLCNAQTQMRLYRTFRKSLKDWKGSGLVARVVLTYHFNNPPESDYLQVCLDVPTVKEPNEPRVEVSQETMALIPSSIMEHVHKVCREYHIEVRVFNYRVQVEAAKKNKEEKQEPYYNGASVEEILRFASIGTQIAIEVFERLEENENVWSQDIELAGFVKSRLEDELGQSYTWVNWAWHFVCNPLLINEGYLTALLAARSNPALNAIRSNLKI